MRALFDGGTVTLTREPGDPRMRTESTLLHHLKIKLNTYPSDVGIDWIKKRMWRDGHMVDEHQQYIRERRERDGHQWAIYHDSYALRDAGQEFDRDGETTLRYINLAEVGQ